eukprot:jgi/Picre1/30696/NNA_006057.t1
MGEFVIPNDPADLWLDERRDDLTLVVSDHSLDFTDENTIVQYSEEISYALCGDNPLCVCEQSKFDVLATIIKEWQSWMDGVLSSPDDSEDRSLLGEYRSAYKVYIFLAQWIAKMSSREAMATSMNASALEAGKKGGGRRKKKDGDWDWQEQSGKLLKSVARCMALDLWKVFRPARPDDAVLVSLIQLSTNCLSCVKDAEAVRHAGQILGLTGLRYQQLDAVSAAMVDLLNQYEHTPAMVAEMLRYSVSEWDDGRLAAAVIQEVASIDAVEYERQQNATGEKAGVRSVAAFVDELAKKLPKLMVTQMSLLLPHLGGKAWTLRSGIITAIGHLLARAFETSDGKEEQDAVIARLRTKQHLLDILCERTRDQSSYTRKAVLQTWQYLAENRAIPLGHWQVVTSIATGRLEDKSSLVRKEAMRLMGCLMLHNPFGPSLPLDKFVASLDIHSAMLEQVMPQVDMPAAQENAETTVKSEPVEHDSSEPDESYNSVREDVYTALVRVVISSEIPDAVWYTVTEASLRALYSLHPKPEDVSCAMIHTLAEQAFAGRDQDDNPPPSYLTSKVFFLIGEISLRHLVLIEKSAKYVRRARLDAERKAAEASGNPSKRNAEEEETLMPTRCWWLAADAELDNMKDAAERQIVQFSQVSSSRLLKW